MLAGTQWPAVVGGFGGELASAGALVATGRDLVVADESVPAGFRTGQWARYGYITTYVPRVRLVDARLTPHGQFTSVDLVMHARHNGETLHVPVAATHEAAIRAVLGAVVANG